MRLRKVLASITAAASLVAFAAAQPAHADTTKPVSDLTRVSGLSAGQREAVESFVKGGRVDVGPSSRSALTAQPSTQAVSSAAAYSRRATYYRGSFLMWTRDNVDFGYDFSRVTWTSAYQQAGSVFPNIARNLGITKYYDTATNDRFRAANRIGAGVVTPWGDVSVYTSDFIHRLSVNHNGAWSAWSD